MIRYGSKSKIFGWLITRQFLSLLMLDRRVKVPHLLWSQSTAGNKFVELTKLEVGGILTCELKYDSRRIRRNKHKKSC